MINTLLRELRRLQGSVLDCARNCCELDLADLRSMQSNIMRVYLHISSNSNQYSFERNLNQINIILFFLSILKVEYMFKIVSNILQSSNLGKHHGLIAFILMGAQLIPGTVKNTARQSSRLCSMRIRS